VTLDDEDIQRIAERIVELLGAYGPRAAFAGITGSGVARAQPSPEPAGLLDAAALARMLGVERAWVYAHAKQLGGIRLGGPRGRLRFDLAQLADRLDPAPAAPVRRQARMPATTRAARRTRGPVQPTKHGLKSPHEQTWPGGAPTPPARHREV
jgi:hypothetical protein